MTPYQQRIVNALLEHKSKTLTEVAELIGASLSRVSAVNKMYDIRPHRKNRKSGVHIGGPMGEVLRVLASRYTIAEAAELSGIGHTTITKLRQGRHAAKLFTFQVLADTAGLEIKLVPKESK